MSGQTALFLGDVMHARLRPRRHKLHYHVFSLLLDLDELPAISATSRLFGHNRRAVLSFWDKDHGDGGSGGLRAWIETRLREAGCHEAGMSLRVLCYPRILGYVFNPLTVYFCYAPNGTLRAILYEVCNTFGERHTYVIAVSGDRSGAIRHGCAKELYVSPFLPMECFYRFHIEPPDETILVRIEESDAGRSVARRLLRRQAPADDRPRAARRPHALPADDPEGHGRNSLGSPAPLAKGRSRSSSPGRSPARCQHRRHAPLRGCQNS